MDSVILGELAAFIMLLGYIPYIKETLTGKTKPNRATGSSGR